MCIHHPLVWKGRHADTLTGTTCKLASASSSTNSPWIAAYQKSGSISSTDEDISLAMHDFNTMYSFTFDLKVASLTSDANPFIPNIGGGSGSPQGSPSYSGPAGTPLGGGSPSASGSGSNFGGFAQDFQLIPTYRKAHAILMGTSVLLLFPIGAIFMRLVGSPLLHALVQLLALCILIAGFAVGVRLADIMQYVSTSIHFSCVPLILVCTHTIRVRKVITNDFCLIALQGPRSHPHHLWNRDCCPLPCPTIHRPRSPFPLQEDWWSHSRLPHPYLDWAHCVNMRSHQWWAGLADQCEY